MYGGSCLLLQRHGSVQHASVLAPGSHPGGGGDARILRSNRTSVSNFNPDFDSDARATMQGNRLHSLLSHSRPFSRFLASHMTPHQQHCHHRHPHHFHRHPSALYMHMTRQIPRAYTSVIRAPGDRLTRRRLYSKVNERTNERTNERHEVVERAAPRVSCAWLVSTPPSAATPSRRVSRALAPPHSRAITRPRVPLATDDSTHTARMAR